MKRCFDLNSYSLYSDEEFPSGPIRDLVGESPMGADPNSIRAFVRRAKSDARTICIKTHEPPGPDTHRALYIVRDGRAALVSYCHYLQDVLGRNISLETVICDSLIPSWSKHVDAWALSGRPNVLVVRHEELVLAGADFLGKLSSFIAHPAVRPSDISFSDLHKLMPAFFRSGSDERNIAEMTKEQLKLFDDHHGSVQAKMGYPRPR